MPSDHRLWPGKARPTNEQGPGSHPATFHCLDAAAVAEAQIALNPTWLRRIAKTVNSSEKSISRLFVQLVALHDIGKLSRSFCEGTLHLPLPDPTNEPAPRPNSHWQISFDMLRSDLLSEALSLLGVPKRQVCNQLLAASAGHHGRPPIATEDGLRDRAGLEAARAYLADLMRLMPPSGSLNFSIDDAKRISWIAAGLTVTSDWIGSNATWFPYARPDITIDDYWQAARHKAQDAVRAAAIGGSRPAPPQSARQLLGVASPRPMQEACSTLPISASPTLIVLEDGTGSGKTEAALMLVNRLMSAGHGEGVYVALPTTATSNAMFDRLSGSYRALFDETSKPSLTLAHGQRLLKTEFREAIDRDFVTATHHDSATSSIEDTEVAAFCSGWIADDRRKAFLAEVGVGTIDQAFMAVLPVKHMVLRLFGLSQRILIVDEAHACDPYMEVELLRLLEMHASTGGSAIVMTATLPSRLRTALVNAFRKGLGCQETRAESSSYPLITMVSGASNPVLELPVQSFEGTARTVEVRRLTSIPNAVDVLLAAARAGACAVWIRNTVDDAIDAYHLLAAEGVDVGLFHARFAMHDRLQIERRIVLQFGYNSSPNERRGRIVIATQVIEQSLDLDFDVMISDLAPVDALIQRLGRLWRHTSLRPANSRPITDCVFHVVGPDPDINVDTNWGNGLIGGSRFVYGLPLLWKTAKVLAQQGTIDCPNNLRALIEGVVGDAAPEIPDALKDIEQELIGTNYGQAARARQNAVSPAAGYLASRAINDDESFPTRADQESAHVILVCRSDHGVIEPYISGDLEGTLSGLNLRPRLLAQLAKAGALLDTDQLPERPAFAQDWPRWRWSAAHLLLLGDNGVITNGFRYDPQFGLQNTPGDLG